MKPTVGVTVSRKGGWRSFLMNRIALWRSGATTSRSKGCRV
jgi:putative glutamine amidotransferase